MSTMLFDTFELIIQKQQRLLQALGFENSIKISKTALRAVQDSIEAEDSLWFQCNGKWYLQ